MGRRISNTGARALRNRDFSSLLPPLKNAIGAQGARGLATGRFTTMDGTLVATVVQEGLVRVPRS